MRSRVVRPETERLTISDGDWLLVKKRLNHGESTEAFARRYLTAADGTTAINLLSVGTARMLAYLLDWSLIDLEGKQIVIRDQPVHVVASALNALDEDSVNEIDLAIAAHERAMDAERAAQKKILTGAPASSETSPSPDA